MISHQSRNFLRLTLESIVLTTVLSACNTVAQVSTPTAASGSPSTTSVMNHGGMNHGGMNHNMDLGPADENYDLRFIDAMIPHHEGAVVMAKDVLQKSKRPELQKLATAIISAQTEEIAQMKQWRKVWYPSVPSTPMAWHTEKSHMMAMNPEQISAMKMDMDLGKADAEYDLRFVKAMIPHHEAAVVMANDLASKTKRPELQKMAKDIIASQQVEIDQMRQWERSWGTR
jgi:uncharacterized protein (DUF305 family)